MKEKIIYDLDPGIDDAISLIVGLNCEQIDIKLITTVFGNISLQKSTLNACYIAQNFEKKTIEIYSGAEVGLDSVLSRDASHVHGSGGLGNTVRAENVIKSTSNKPDFGAVEAMHQVICENPNEITIVSVGPVTNIAKLLIKYPDDAKLLKGIVLMVGSLDGKGSVTPYSSFNCFCDPEAVDVVIKTKVPITISPKEMGIWSAFDTEQRNKFKKFGKAGRFIYDLCDGYRDSLLPPDKYAMHDTCALLSILDTDIFTRKKVKMSVNTTSEEKRGQTLFEESVDSNITLLTNVNKQKLFEKVENILSL